MHLSLKGSLIRSPMLNRVGQRLLQLFEGASAAYSLRDLASNIASVVRVRRASDNSEKDFSAADVSSGAMTQWVNGQVVPPLDVRELVDGERTGALIPAAAAYSLRNLSTSYTGNVVDVRRSSDDAEDSFTAAEVADGTLEDWVNTDVVRYESNFSAGVNGWTGQNGSLVGNEDGVFGKDNVAKFTINSSTSSFHQLYESGLMQEGETFRVEADVYFPSSNSHIDGLSFVKDGDVYATFSSQQTDQWITLSSEFTYTTASTVLGLRFRDGNSFTITDSAGDDVAYISNIRVTQTAADGFVTQWYDQSGNANHATQGTNASQPKIVDGGSLVSGGLDFDGVNDKLSFDSSVSLSTNDFYFASVISILDGNREDIAPVGNAAGNRFLISLDYDNDRAQMRADDGTFLTQPFTRTVPANETLISISTVSNTATLRCETNSAAVFDTTGESFTLGSMGQVNPSTYSKHSIKELIIYTSDQSDNRTAFEANIGETYGINLPSGVDTGYDEVDGFVETWYDQSGNGNDAVQQVSGNQPKIVDAGVLVTNDEGNPAIQGATGKSFGLSPITGLEDVSIFFVGAVPSSFQAITGWNTNLHMVRFSDSHWEFTANLADPGNMDWNSALTSGDTALFNFTRSSGTVTGYANSVASDTTSNANSNPFSLNRIFTRSAVNYNDYQGKASELIIYNSDQSANRAAIEANINNQYDIY